MLLVAAAATPSRRRTEGNRPLSKHRQAGRRRRTTPAQPPHAGEAWEQHTAPIAYPSEPTTPAADDLYQESPPRERRWRRHGGTGAGTRLPSVTEVALYVLLAGGTAGAVLVAAGHPMIDAAVVGGATVALVVVLALVSRRAGRPVRRDAAPPPAAEPSPAEDADTGDEAPWTAFDDPYRGRRG